MKINTKVVFEWDKDLGKYVEIFSDSYEHEGEIAKCYHQQHAPGMGPDPAAWGPDGNYIAYTSYGNGYFMHQYNPSNGTWSSGNYVQGVASQDEIHNAMAVADMLYYDHQTIGSQEYQQMLTDAQNLPGNNAPPHGVLIEGMSSQDIQGTSPSDLGFSQWEVSNSNEWNTFGDAPQGKIGSPATPDPSELTASLDPAPWMEERVAQTGETGTELTRTGQEFTESEDYKSTAYAQGYNPTVEGYLGLTMGQGMADWWNPNKREFQFMGKTWDEMNVPEHLKGYAPTPAEWDDWGLTGSSLLDYWPDPNLGPMGGLMRDAQATMEGVPLREAGHLYGGSDDYETGAKLEAKHEFVADMPGGAQKSYQDIYTSAAQDIHQQEEFIYEKEQAEQTALENYEFLLGPNMTPDEYVAGISPGGAIDPVTGVGLLTPDILSAQTQGATAVAGAEADVVGAEIGAVAGSQALYEGLYSPGGDAEQLQNALESNIITAETAAESLVGGAGGYIPGMEAQELGWEQGLERWGQELGVGEEDRVRALESIGEEARLTAGGAGDKLVGMKLNELAQSYAKGGAQFGSPMNLEEKGLRKQHGLAIKDIAKRRGIERENWEQQLEDYGFEEVDGEIVPTLLDPDDETSYDPGSVIGQAHEARTAEEHASLQSTLAGLESRGFKVDPAYGTGDLTLEEYYDSIAGTDWTAAQIAQNIIPTGWDPNTETYSGDTSGDVGTYLQNYLTGMSGAEQTYMDQLLQHGGYWDPNAGGEGVGGFVSFDPATYEGDLPTSVSSVDPITGLSRDLSLGLPGTGGEAGWLETGVGQAQAAQTDAETLWGVPGEGGAYPVGSNIGDIMRDDATGIRAGQQGWQNAAADVYHEEMEMEDWIKPGLFGQGGTQYAPTGGALGQAAGIYGLWAPGQEAVSSLEGQFPHMGVIPDEYVWDQSADPWGIMAEGSAQNIARSGLTGGWEGMTEEVTDLSGGLAGTWGSALSEGIGNWHTGWQGLWTALAEKDAGN